MGLLAVPAKLMTLWWTCCVALPAALVARVAGALAGGLGPGASAPSDAADKLRARLEAAEGRARDAARRCAAAERRAQEAEARARELRATEQERTPPPSAAARAGGGELRKAAAGPQAAPPGLALYLSLGACGAALAALYAHAPYRSLERKVVQVAALPAAWLYLVQLKGRTPTAVLFICGVAWFLTGFAVHAVLVPPAPAAAHLLLQAA